MSQFCPHCGSSIQDDANFCPSCGKIIKTVPANPPIAENKKLITAILAILLGYLGIQYFYIGKPTAGVISIILGLCTCGIWGIITLIQGILILLMSDEEFNAKYINTDKSFPIF